MYLREIRLKEYTGEEDYLKALPFLQDLQKTPLEFRSPVTFFVGENGTGKSTLLEAIAVALGFNAEGGSRDFLFSTRKNHSDLHAYLQYVRSGVLRDGFFLRAESFYNAATYLEESGSLMKRYGGKSLHEQSHGEAFLSLVLNRFTPEGIYLLDEPEAALSPQRLLALLAAVDRLAKGGAQFIIVTHSPILMAYPGADILQFDEAGISRVGYRETEHYRLMKQILDDPERMMHYLLDENE